VLHYRPLSGLGGGGALHYLPSAGVGRRRATLPVLCRGWEEERYITCPLPGLGGGGALHYLPSAGVRRWGATKMASKMGGRHLQARWLSGKLRWIGLFRKEDE